MQGSRVKLQHPRLTSGVLGSLAIVIGAALLVLRSVPQEGWVAAIILALSAVLVGGREWLAHREAGTQAEGERLAALRCAPCAVRDSDPFALGVTPSEIADRFRGAAARPPYIQRDVDAELDRLLRDSFFVVLIGPSKAGKSRTAFEAISRVFPRRALIAPELPGFDREGLAEAVASFIASSDEGVVVWLDDLQEYLKAKAVAPHDLNAWRNSPQEVVVVATIRAGELSALRGTDLEVERVVDLAKAVALSSSLSPREREDATAVYPDEDFRDGIGVHFVAGQRLVERLVSGREINPAGYAMACAAIDRRRAGVSSPATDEELIELASEYLHEVHPRTDLDSAMAISGLAWAAEPVIQDIGLLLSPNENLFEPFEYVVAYRDGEVGRGGRVRIPQAVVDMLIERHDGWHLRGVGYAAMVRHEYDRAIRAFRKLSQNADPHIAAHGIEDLGRALLDAGKTEEGLLRLREAAECDYPCVVAPASFGLAIRLVSEDEAQAENLYRRVLEHPQSRVYPKALVNLGLVLRSKTSVKSDRNDFGVNFESVDPAELSEDDRELEREARRMFEDAIKSSDREARANGGMALGVLLESRGDPAGAANAFKAGVAAGGHQPRIALAQMYAKDSETLSQARELIEDMDEEEMHPDSVAYMHRVASRIAQAEETIDREIEDLRNAMAESQPSSLAESRQMRLATFLTRRGSTEDFEEASDHFRQVIDSGSVLSAEAKLALARLHEFVNNEAT